MPAKTMQDVAGEWANKILSSRTPCPWLQDALPELVADAKREQTAQVEMLLTSLAATWAFRNGRAADTVTDAERSQLRAALHRCLADASQLQAEIDLAAYASAAADVPNE